MISEPQSGDNALSRARGGAARQRAATIEGAWLTFQEREQGSIEPGKRADFVVLSEDRLTVPEKRLPGIVADLTVAGGRVVYERAAGSATLPLVKG